MRFSTIAAVSTPRGKGGVAVLRVSGPDALSIGESVFRPMGKKKISEYPPRTQIYGEILSSDGSSVLDDGLVTYFVGPHSFTGEDVVEFACHGGEVITAMILSALLEAGASPAEPGEYSRRAFLNGKLSLTAAEGVADLLDAKTESAALLSSKTARGRLSHAIDAISRDLLEITSSLWAYLDYPEEDLETMSDEEMISSLEKILSSCDRLLKSYQTGRAVNSGISAAIIGKPNVGKSSFFNALLGEERAIVTDLPGTTRDLIEYPVTVGRVLLNLQDSAGIRSETADRVEKIGIEKALLAAEQAEMIFCLLDLSRPLEEEDERILSLAREKSSSCYVLPVLTKKDLPRCWNPSDLGLEDWVEISVKENWEPDELVSRLESRFISDEAALREGQILTNARQKSALVRAREEIFRAAEEIQGGMKDVASLTLESALSALKEMDGQNVGEMILDQVFSRFCIGK